MEHSTCGSVFAAAFFSPTNYNGMWPRVLSDKHWGVARSLSLFHWDLFYRLFWVLIVLKLKWKLLAQGRVLEIAHAHGQDIFKESTHSLWERKCKRSFEGTYFFGAALASVSSWIFSAKREICMQESNIFLRGTRLLCVLLLDNSKCSEAWEGQDGYRSH